MCCFRFDFQFHVAKVRPAHITPSCMRPQIWLWEGSSGCSPYQPLLGRNKVWGIGIVWILSSADLARSVFEHSWFSKTWVKRPLSERRKIGFQDQLSLNAGQKYCRMLQREHSAILSTFIKLPVVIKTFILSIFEWPFYTGFTVDSHQGVICAYHSFCYCCCY